MVWASFTAFIWLDGTQTKWILSGWALWGSCMRFTVKNYWCVNGSLVSSQAFYLAAGRCGGE